MPLIKKTTSKSTLETCKYAKGSVVARVHTCTSEKTYDIDDILTSNNQINGFSNKSKIRIDIHKQRKTTFPQVRLIINGR